MKRIQTACRLAMGSLVLMAVLTISAAVAHAEQTVPGAAAVSQTYGAVQQAAAAGAPYYAIALVMSAACLSAAYAVGKVGAAALGAAAEKPELLGKAIVFVGLGEGIAIFGLIISLMLINKLG